MLDRTGKFLCGCYFTEEDTCVTSVGCISGGLSPADLQIAVGVYDHVNPLAVQEPPSSPKPAQLVHVDAIESTDQVALLFIRESVRLNYYTLPICVDRQRGIPFANYDDCVATGWGPADSTAHWFDVKLLSTTECVGLIAGGFDGTRQSCARAHGAENVCNQVEFGGGLQCRYLGDRSSRKNDIYWLKGVLASCTADLIVYDHLDIDWFETSLMNHHQ